MTLDLDNIAAFAAWQSRYGEESGDAELIWNKTIEVILGHRSVRSFRSDPLPENTIPTIIAAAQSASTSSNLQTWSVVAVQDAEQRGRLAVLAHDQQYIRDAPLHLVWLCDVSRLRRLAHLRNRELAGLDYLDSLMMGVVDTALAAQAGVIALESIGLNSVFIGAMRNHPAEVARELGLPEGVFAVFGMCVGYADTARPGAVKPRLPQSLVLDHGRYAPQLDDAAIERYDRAMTAFNAAQGRPGDWIDTSLDRVEHRESLHGRHVLKQVLEDLGFPML